MLWVMWVEGGWIPQLSDKSECTLPLKEEGWKTESVPAVPTLVICDGGFCSKGSSDFNARARDFSYLHVGCRIGRAGGTSASGERQENQQTSPRAHRRLHRLHLRHLADPVRALRRLLRGELELGSDAIRRDTERHPFERVQQFDLQVCLRPQARPVDDEQRSSFDLR
mmetsp:Transcript_40111/g.126111  ORF Transcript_40111/g.126111 Transcript_40111/m.126111 type:complete len:168 (-) Transcript_40111:760-1263(-)